MRKWFGGAAVLMLAACATVKTPAADPQAVQVMVIGVWHFDNPGQDIANVKTESVLTPERQKELQTAVAAIAAFKPTAVAVERQTMAPAYIDPKFPLFDAAMLASNADERVQLGYRLAKTAGVTRVYGVDEQSDDSEPDYFPFDKLQAQAEATAQGEQLNATIAELQTVAGRFADKQKSRTISQMLIEANSGEMSDPGFYYETFRYDRGEAQPGAELQAYWFMRNAKIFSKIAQVAKPGDRIVVVYGAGHKFWLEHFADETPGFVRVDPTFYLKAAK